MPGKRLMVAWKETDSNWYGNYRIEESEIKLVEVSLLEDEPGSLFRIAVWGDDDFGKEKEYKTKEDALADLHAILAQKRVNVGFLVDMDFVNA